MLERMPPEGRDEDPRIGAATAGQRGREEAAGRARRPIPEPEQQIGSVRIGGRRAFKPHFWLPWFCIVIAASLIGFVVSYGSHDNEQSWSVARCLSPMPLAPAKLRGQGARRPIRGNRH